MPTEIRQSGAAPGPPELRDQAGFTLLETLVALAVLGVVLTTLFRLAGDTLVQYQSREARLRLALAAEAVLTAARLGEAGVVDIEWPEDLSVTVERQGLATAATDGFDLPEAAVADDLDWLSVRVVDADGRSFTLGGAVAGQRR